MGSEKEVQNGGSGGVKDEEPSSGEGRENWGGQLEFILTMVGFAVGLGNVWRFPYLCYSNGGGAFLIPYILMLIFVGLPLFYMELSFGQFASLGPITIWLINPLLKGLGFASVIVAAYIIIYYNVIVSWCLFYFFASMSSKLPWTDCNNWWNTELCRDQSNSNMTFPENVTTKTASEEYYYRHVLRMTDGIEDMGVVRWQLALLLLLAWIIVFLVLLKGIASLGKAAYFVSLFPYVLLTIMLGRGASLPGAISGITYYIKPEFSRLADAKVWGDAATQIFYSLGCCMGSLIAMASFNKFNNNVRRDSLLIPVINCCTSIYAGFVIFSVLGYMAEEKGVPVSEVATEGPGLVFVVYPEGLATMPIAPLWSVLFFFMMTTLGFSSQFSMAEGVCSAFMDEFPEFFRQGLRPTYLRLVFCVVGYLLGLPMVTEGGFYLFKIMDDYTAGYTLLVVGLLELIALMWVYGYHRFTEDIALMLGTKPGKYWFVCWKFLTPLIIIFVLIFKSIQQVPLTFGDYVYPDWANTLAWLIVAFPMVVIVGYIIGLTCYNGGYQLLKETSQPTPDWGPALPENKSGKYAVTQDMMRTHPVMPYPGQRSETSSISGSTFQPPPYNGNTLATTAQISPRSTQEKKDGSTSLANKTDNNVFSIPKSASYYGEFQNFGFEPDHTHGEKTSKL